MAIGGENGETVGGYFRAAECVGSHYNLRVKECFVVVYRGRISICYSIEYKEQITNLGS